MGPAGNLMVMAVICMYNFLLAPYKENPDTGKIERRMNMFLNLTIASSIRSNVRHFKLARLVELVNLMK